MRTCAKYSRWSVSSLPVSTSGGMPNELIWPPLSGGGVMSAGSVGKGARLRSAGRVGLLVVFGLGCLPWRGLPGQK